MPALLQPKTALAPEAIVVGDPGRALLLAQELLEQPKMSNHARGLWGYSGQTADGRELTIQATGVGAPSAAAVLADLAELGVRRAVRIGTCTGLEAGQRPGELLLVTEAEAAEGSAAAMGIPAGSTVEPDPGLLEGLRRALGSGAREARVLSLDSVPRAGVLAVAGGIAAADMQTLAVLTTGRARGIATAALLTVAEGAGGEAASAEQLEQAAKRAGRAVITALSPSSRGLEEG